MDTNLDKIRSLIDILKNTGFWGRLFRWGEIQRRLVDANGELQKFTAAVESRSSENLRLEGNLSVEREKYKNLQESMHRLMTENEVLKNSGSNQSKLIESLQNSVTTLTTKNDQYLKRGSELSNELSTEKQKLESSEKELRTLRDENARLKKDEEFRKQETSNNLASLKQIQEKLQKDRDKERDDKEAAEIYRIMKQKETWSNHEERVKNAVKTICSKHTVEYVEKVPFKGEPDNTIKIIDEYVIFDAKSPASDDLTNFPSYVKNQTESVKKYAKEENVRKEIFLVVPTNTLEVLDSFIYRLPDYTVYIISLDSLEPIIVSLKTIEEYEFAQELSPEERDNICRVLGKFAHLSKRRIQIDAFFAKQFLELVYRGEADLPKDILEKVNEFEKSEKINPPIEKRAKQISIKELETDTTKLNTDANAKGIITENALLSKSLNRLPLYSADLEETKDEEQGSLF